jgi:hypothetical protein
MIGSGKQHLYTMWHTHVQNISTSRVVRAWYPCIQATTSFKP